MQKITYISGGQRSGKSRYAQKLASQWSQKPIYLATARHWDNDFETRIQRHKADRGNEWQTVECEKNLNELHFAENDVVLLDCITLWLTNIFHDCNYNLDDTVKKAKDIWTDFINKNNCTLIAVSNEIGMGMHADTEIGRHFADLQGWINQFVAQNATDAFVMISGLPLKIK